ncbi:hypothetical protein, partial [Roseibium sp. RKSG952]|uniref:hypothetical protein n=1 Tax=Roseibium sp. RKSG952 TaxID=2529384 RepID=UPI0012BC0F58
MTLEILEDKTEIKNAKDIVFETFKKIFPEDKLEENVGIYFYTGSDKSKNSHIGGFLKYGVNCLQVGIAKKLGNNDHAAFLARDAKDSSFHLVHVLKSRRARSFGLKSEYLRKGFSTSYKVPIVKIPRDKHSPVIGISFGPFSK